MVKKEEKYTHPDLREEIKASDKGGNKGQWSARKSQLLTQEYEKRGGGYTGGKDESQKNLEKWTDEEWQTQEGDTKARSGDETARYLPEETWEKMSDEEKREGSKQGKQYVANTEEAKQARKHSQAPPLKDYDDLGVEDIERKVKGLSKEGVQVVLGYEKRHKNRKTLVESLDRKTQHATPRKRAPRVPRRPPTVRTCVGKAGDSVPGFRLVLPCLAC